MFYQGKVVLVAGGTGMVGTHIVQELLNHGAKVRVPIHKRPLTIKSENITTLHANLTREEDCLAAVKGVDYVFNVAGPVGSAALTATDSMAGMMENLIIAARMLHAAWVEQVDKFLLLSSSTVYPPADYAIKEEEAWSGPTYPSYFGYGWMKRYLERLAEHVASQSDVNIALARTTAPYGRWDNFDPSTGHVIPALVRRAVERHEPFVVWGTGEEVRDFIHVTDLARGCLMMLESYSICDPVNIGYGKVATIKEIVQIILKAAGHADANVEFDDSKPSTAPIRMVDTSKAKRILDFEPEVSLEAGLTDTVKWYAEAKAETALRSTS